jgi:hypothetical protein
LTGNGDEVVLLYPSHHGGWGAGAVAEVVELDGGVISGLFNEP